jgi:RNA polymerase-interacting CarD/CdnL/TRCF family regulator
MDHQTGDVIVHASFGVGHITAVEEMEFIADEQALFYRVAFDKTTIWIPVQNEHSSRFRSLTPKADLARYRAVLASKPGLLADDFRIRQDELASRLKQGSFQDLCEIVRDLRAFSTEKELNKSDQTLLNKARLSLEQEWAASSGISQEQASLEIQEILTE